MSAEISNLGRQMAKAAAWTVSTRIAIRGIGLVSIVILARLLVPEDFGLVALATMFYGLLEVMGQFSFDVVLIQNQTAGRRHYDTAWTLSVLRNLVLAGLLVAGAPWAAGFFEEPRLAAILYWLALAAFIEGFANIGVVNFRKELQFHKDFAFMVGAKLGMFVVAVPLAFIWRDYWALVAGIVAGAFIRVALGYLMQPYRPRPSLAKWREIIGFSKWLVLNNIIGFAYNRSDIFIIGKIVGTQSLGLYAVAHEIATLPTSELVAPIRRALFPGYAKMSGDPNSLSEGFLQVFSLGLMIGIPAAAGIGLIADPLVKVLLGEKWLECIPLIQVLAVYGALTVLTLGSRPIYLALGKPQIVTFLSLVATGVLIPLLIWGVVAAGVYGAAWALTSATAILVLMDVCFALRLFCLPAARLFWAAWRTPGATLIMILVVQTVVYSWPDGEALSHLALELASLVTIGAASYIGAHLVLWQLSGLPDGAERHILSAIQSVLVKVSGNRGYGKG